MRAIIYSMIDLQLNHRRSLPIRSVCRALSIQELSDYVGLAEDNNGLPENAEVNYVT